MKGIKALFLGIFGTFAFSWVGLVLIPNSQIGHLDPQIDEDDIYPMPKSGMAERGRQIYAANGCAYCHSQQIRADYAGSDLERTRGDHQDKDRPKWGERRSAPRDYVFDRPVLLGKMRLGPDLANIGKSTPVEEAAATAPAAPAPGASPAASAPAPGTSPAASTTAATTPPAAATKPTPTNSPAAPSGSPAATAVVAAGAAPTGTTQVASTNGIPLRYSADWHHRHLYSPRSLTRDSNMPAYQFLYQKRQINSERAADAVKLESIPTGWEVVPTYDAKCLVAYLMSLDQSHGLKEVKGAPGAAAPAAQKK